MPGSIRFAAAIIVLSAGGYLFAESQAQPQGAPGPWQLSVAAVQLEIPGAAVVQPSVFENLIEGSLELIMRRERPDLVVFPEYTSVFPSLFPYQAEVTASTTIGEVHSNITAAYPAIRSPLDAFNMHHAQTEAYLDELWGSMARKFSVNIVAGSYFAVHRRDDGIVELRNRMLYYTKDGRRHYSQDKVFPTPFETDFLGLSAGKLAQASVLEVDGAAVGITICNDTFYEAWETRFDAVDLWIDIKGNNADFTSETAALFAEALPARLSGTDGVFGLTVCLGGTFLDLFWEGPTNLITGGADGYRVINQAPAPDEPSILIAFLAGEN